MLGRCGIDVRGRSRKLRLNYRTTEETRRWAARLLAGRAIDDLDGGADDDRGVTSLTRGPEPLLRRFESAAEQSAFLAAYLKQVQARDERASASAFDLDPVGSLQCNSAQHVAFARRPRGVTTSAPDPIAATAPPAARFGTSARGGPPAARRRASARRSGTPRTP